MTTMPFFASVCRCEPRRLDRKDQRQNGFEHEQNTQQNKNENETGRRKRVVATNVRAYG